MYTNKSSQFVGLVKGEYGHTPVKIDPEFRFKICGVREETPYDTSKYQMQPNPELPEAGGVKLAANEKEVLLLELFPMVAKTFLTDQKKKAYEATAAKDTPKTAARSEHKVEAKAITGHKVTAPLPGKHHRPEGEGRRQGKSRTGSGYPRSDEDGKLDHQRRGGYDQADSRTGRRQRRNRCHPGGSGRIAPFRKYHPTGPEKSTGPVFLLQINSIFDFFASAKCK